MKENHIWYGNRSWPSSQSLKIFTLDVFRLENADSDKKKAFAFYKWFTRCMQRGPNPRTPNGCGGYSLCFDPLVDWASWGHGECTYWGWIATEALCSAGMKARRVVVHNSGHTYYEIWYKGDDGKAQWHAFDPFGGWFFLNESGEVASCKELADNPQLVQNPLPGHPLPLGHHPERNNIGHRHRTEDQLFIDQPIRDERLSWNLQKGQTVTINWLPEAPDKALFTKHPEIGENPVDNSPDGAHDDMAEISKEGMLAYPEHEPYWKNYRWATRDTSYLNEGRPVRWHGAGALRWNPLNFGKEAAKYAINAKFDAGTLKPVAPHDFTEVWYHIKLPFLISYLSIDYDIAGAGNDYCGFSISADDRRTIWPLKMKSNTPHWGNILNGQKEWKTGEPSVQGLREFWLRIDMFTHNENPTLALQALRMSVGFQHNMDIQPKLIPGNNTLWLEAETLDENTTLSAEWNYLLDGLPVKAAVELTLPGKAENLVNIDAECPSQIKMTGLNLNCR